MREYVLGRYCIPYNDYIIKINKFTTSRSKPRTEATLQRWVDQVLRSRLHNKNEEQRTTILLENKIPLQFEILHNIQIV